MAFSASTNFTYTRDQVIKAALRKCRAYDADVDTPEAYQTRDAAEALNLIHKSLQLQGTLLWVVKDQEINLSKGKRVYTIGPSGDTNTDRPLRISDPRWRDISDNTDIPVTLVGRQDYNGLTNKFATGRPTWVYYDRKIVLGEISVWPVPEDSKGKLFVTADIPLQDFDASGDDAHMPSYAYAYFVWALAADLASEYGIPLQESMVWEQKAAGLKDDLIDFEEEESGFQLIPDYSYSGGFN